MVRSRGWRGEDNVFMDVSHARREYTTGFRTMFPDLVAANHATLIPFLLEGVGGIPALNLPDGIHPNPAGHKIIAKNVWRFSN